MSEWNPSDVRVYTSGLVSCSVCVPADMPIEDVELFVNIDNPTGISSKWQVSNEPFADGQPNPCICNQDTTRKHYLLHC